MNRFYEEGRISQEVKHFEDGTFEIVKKLCNKGSRFNPKILDFYKGKDIVGCSESNNNKETSIPRSKKELKFKLIMDQWEFLEKYHKNRIERESV